MESYIQISKINDFTFCPFSLYFHSVYEGFDGIHYKAEPQVAGKIAHKVIDEKQYSSRKNILEGIEVFSSYYGVIGKIDIYDKDKKELIERKRMIRKIYAGYLFQLYAQKCALEEMGYPVKKMTLHSLVDNKRYTVNLSPEKMQKFENTLERMRNFDLLSSKKSISKNKCENCIYRELCRKNI